MGTDDFYGFSFSSCQKGKFIRIIGIDGYFLFSISISIQIIPLSIWCFIMSEEYKFVAPGKLKLKGSALKIAKTSHNKTYANVPHQSIHQNNHFLIDLFIGKRRRVLLKS